MNVITALVARLVDAGWDFDAALAWSLRQAKENNPELWSGVVAELAGVTA